MYTENELKVAKFLGINPDYILGFKKDPELKGFVTDLITLQKNSNSMDAEISRLPPPAPGGKTLEEVLREVRQEVWDSLTFGYACASSVGGSATPRVEYTCLHPGISPECARSHSTLGVE